ncbi:mitochondrial 54s ribosomal protein 41 [Diplodia corticola]|uniref:Large ribosomal subunit protein uL23m n=1 Tax=Diplodia corticola TaxID=236234 RepID=A0A1J9RAW7_9PEZI|nr:mitochondrial 54s ribosomal protein 41 [Diplodia corticola]OJD37696.1 mitochondrial 54s ribosomal protein 41 [Diplodia corticola]
MAAPKLGLYFRPHFRVGQKAVYLYAALPRASNPRTHVSPAPHTPPPHTSANPPPSNLTRTTTTPHIPAAANAPSLPRTRRPDFTITLLRSSFLPPTFAKFIVPLKLNKLDMRDYLWHAYGVKVTNVRSFVQQAKIRQDDPARKRAMPRRWYRGPSIKKMTVEMDKPFVWPDEPEDWAPYGRDLYRAAEEFSEKEQAKMMPEAAYDGPRDAPTLREQAERLRSGAEEWVPGRI